MRCDVCGTIAQPAPTNRAIRCLNCGTLMNVTAATAPPPVVVAASNHAYSTPHGKLSAQVQGNGTWVVAVSLTPAAGKSDATAILVKNLLSSWATLNDAALPRLHSFAAKELRCIWALPGSVGFVPLAARRPPLESAEVRKLVIALAEPLGRLHRLGLAAYDLSPSLIFEARGTGRTVLIPTPWLASLAQWAPAKVGELPFVAPELSLNQQASSDPVAADLFALGALAWFLLTGGLRTGAATQLPIEVAPALASWDAFIDGCCRTNPARRFASIDLAIQSLPSQSPATRFPANPPAFVARPAPSQVVSPVVSPTQVPVSPGRNYQFRVRRALLLGLPAVAAFGGAVYFRDFVFKHVPVLNGGYRRGYGDTVLRYSDRSYESQWVLLPEADRDSVGNGRSNNRLEYKQVTGWDENNFWVIADDRSKSVIVPFREGHWKTPEELSSTPAPIARALDQERLLVASGTMADSVFEVSPSGNVALRAEKGSKKEGGKRGRGSGGEGDNRRKGSGGSGGRNSGYRSIFTINSDLYYLACADHNNTVVKVADGVWSELRPEKFDEEAFLRDEDKRMVKEHLVCHVRQTHTYSPGKAVGVYDDMRGRATKVVEYREGFWYIVDSLKDLDQKKCKATWLISDGSKPTSLMIVGEGGYVYRKDFPGSGATLPTVPPQKSSRKLILVWGVDRDKFWVMDDNGTIWEWNAKEWSLIVNGMFHKDIEFVDAWVSPRGTVIAVTKTQIYRLE